MADQPAEFLDDGFTDHFESGEPVGVRKGEFLELCGPQPELSVSGIEKLDEADTSG